MDPIPLDSIPELPVLPCSLIVTVSCSTITRLWDTHTMLHNLIMHPNHRSFNFLKSQSFPTPKTSKDLTPRQLCLSAYSYIAPEIDLISSLWLLSSSRSTSCTIHTIHSSLHVELSTALTSFIQSRCSYSLGRDGGRAKFLIQAAGGSAVSRRATSCGRWPLPNYKRPTWLFATPRTT